MEPIGFDMVVLREGKTFVAYSPELDLSSCGASIEQARSNLKTAVRLFLEEAQKMGTLKDILAEAGFQRDSSGKWSPPSLVATELVELA